MIEMQWVKIGFLDPDYWDKSVEVGTGYQGMKLQYRYKRHKVGTFSSNEEAIEWSEWQDVEINLDE
jgi:hypothetical protein